MLSDWDCGCDTRKITIGSDHFWCGVIAGSAILALGLSKGGIVTKQTKNLVSIAMFGAVSALVIENVLRPRFPKTS